MKKLKITDLTIFKFYSYNREVIDENKINKIVKSMQEEGFREYQAIICGKDFYVADGQNRLEAAKRLNIPVWAEIYDKVFTAEEIRNINKDSTSWTLADVIHSKSDDDSKRLTQFIKYCRESFGYVQSTSFRIAMASAGRDQHRRSETYEFSDSDLMNAYAFVGELESIRKHFKKANSQAFVGAYIRAKRCETFSLSVFLKKLEYNHIEPSSTTLDYALQIESIYNYKKAKNTKELVIDKSGIKRRF